MVQWCFRDLKLCFFASSVRTFYFSGRNTLLKYTRNFLLTGSRDSISRHRWLRLHITMRSTHIKWNVEGAWKCGSHLAGFTSKTPMAGFNGKLSFFFSMFKKWSRQLVWLSVMPDIVCGAHSWHLCIRLLSTSSFCWLTQSCLLVSGTQRWVSLEANPVRAYGGALQG